MRKLGNQNFRWCLPHTTAGTEPHLNEPFVNDELESLIDGSILDFLQQGPLLRRPGGPKNRETLRRRKRDVPPGAMSLADAKAEGARVEVVYSAAQAVELARATRDEVVFFASGFETTAVATAAVVLDDPPPNFSVLSAHKYIPPVMEIVAEMPETRVEGFLAAGHAATITGCAIFERFVEQHRIPVVVAGFEPLDILAGLVKLAELVRDGTPRVVNTFPRCVTPEGNRNAQAQLWRVFRTTGGRWRGIAHVPNGNLRLRDEFAHVDARRRFRIDLQRLWTHAPSVLTQSCICGDIMAGIATPAACPLFGRACVPDSPVGACMVSSEGTCRIWYQYGGHPAL